MSVAASRTVLPPEERAVLRRAFVVGAGWGDAKEKALPADASFRRYYRLQGGRSSALIMDAPPEREAVAPFVRVARHLAALGFSAPHILACDEEAGFLLLEDFGDRTFTRLLAEGASEEGLYRLAVDLLVALHGREDADGIVLPAYDLGPLLDEAALFVDWYWPEKQGRPCPAELRADYLAAWRAVFAALPPAPATFVHRDFHVDNLMLLKEREGLAACGLLDFQDALIGPPAYDLVSLLEDARRDIDPALVAQLYGRYCAGVGDLDHAGFAASYAALGAQRHAKVAGIFTRLLRRDGKDAYLKHIPRVLRLLDRQLGQVPELEPVQAWMAEHLPDLTTPPQVVTDR